MQRWHLTTFFAGALLAVTCCTAQVQALPYGANVSQEQAQRVVAAAMAEARKNDFNMAVAVVDTAGNLVAFERMDLVPSSAVTVSQGKAHTAAVFRRPTKLFQEGLVAGGAGLAALSIPGLVPIEGGEPIRVEGKVIGAVGVSGGMAAQDSQVAKAALESLGK